MILADEAPSSGDSAKALHKKLLSWFFWEKDTVQAFNRVEMAIDANFYDGLQWDEQDVAVLKERLQLPLVYNELAPIVDWLIGTERRAKVDWRVLPRTEDAVESADIKTKVLKYVSDINKCQHNRSKAFADAIKVGIGWLDDGINNDITKDVIYSGYEDWRNVVWDSSCYDLGLSDAKYIFRWRWVDEDVAVAMMPDKSDAIRRAVEGSKYAVSDDWSMTSDNTGTGVVGTTSYPRRQVRLIEAQYRTPVNSVIIAEGPFKGQFAKEDFVGRTTNRVISRVHYAILTEGEILRHGLSPFNHNRFSLTPVWCYRRTKDRLPYGVIRRARDIQMDLNKRASKALWLLNTNQVFAEEGAASDWDELLEQVAKPDGLILTKPGRKAEVKRNDDLAAGQLSMMTLARESIQRSAGVTQENLGRPTNAVSGIAIQARQLQGSVVMTEPFDNLRLAVQLQGEKQLSLIEQFMTEEMVIRRTGAKEQFDWVRINYPELQADGTIRYLNDIQASMAEFKVTDVDYAGTIRHVMFDALHSLANKLPPEVALRLMTIAIDYSDLPNRHEINDQIKRMLGEMPSTEKLGPEEQAALEQQALAQEQEAALQRQKQMLTLQEQQSRIREANARAAKMEGDTNTEKAVAEALEQAEQDHQAQLDIINERLSKSIQALRARTQPGA